jgi:segregation and condensation protein A
MVSFRMFSVETSTFQGPLALLLELIEAEKVDISEVSLGQVTEGYLRYLEAHPGIPPEELADFLVVASKLVLIKSRLLLPELPEVEEAEPSLESQLRLYREYALASKVIAGLLGAGRLLYVHEKLPPFDVGFVPPEKFGIEQLHAVILAVLKRLAPTHRLPNAAIEAAVSIHDKIAELRGLLDKAKHASFGAMVRGSRSRTEVVVCFLALLELVKQRSVRVEQDARFGDIVISSVVPV